MRFSDYIRLAFLNLRRQKLRTFLTVIAVMIGAVAVLSLVSLGSTVKTVFKEQLKAIGALTQIMVSKQGEGGGPFGGSELEQIDGKQIKITENVVQKMRQIKGVQSIAPMVYLWEIEGVKKGSKTYAFRVSGTGIDNKTKVSAGRFFNDENEHSIILSGKYVSGLGFANPKEAIGQEVYLVTKPEYRGEGMAITQKMQEDVKKRSYLKARIIGVAESGPGQDDSQSFIPLGWAKKMKIQKNYKFEEGKNKFEKGKMRVEIWDDIKQNGYDTLVIKAKAVKDIKPITKEIKKQFGLEAISIQEILEQIFKGLSVIQTVLGFIGGIALLVAMIGIVNTMFMSIYERTREIGVMRACGATKKSIRRLFTFEAAIIGFMGGGIGVLLTFSLRYVGNILLNNMAQDQGVTFSNVITIPMWLIGSILIFTTVLGIAAGFFPAQRAARMDPVDALRYE